MKVTQIAYSKNLTPSKYKQLETLAGRLGRLRREIWNQFGSLSGVGLTHRLIRDRWLREKKPFDVPARLWKETLRDVMADIELYREAAKEKVRRAVYKRFSTPEDRRKAYRSLKDESWVNDPYLRRLMRKYYKHGHTNVRNQIILDSGCYSTFISREQAWLSVMSLDKGKRLSIPLNTKLAPTGTLRLILQFGKVEVHYTRLVTASTHNLSKSGEKELGVDKGYTEVFTDSDGEVHGETLGKVLTAESDSLKKKYQRRNKLKAIYNRALLSGNISKAQTIQENNLGRRKLNRRKIKYTKQVKDIVFKATHSLFDQAAVVVAEDLTARFSSKSRGKNTNRRLAGWVKGLIATALDSVSRRRSASVVLVNPAYTSQMDSRNGLLIGERFGDSFHCFDGVVLAADENAARNILARMQDTEITLYTPHKKVKQILQDRTRHRLGLLNQDSRCQEGEDNFAPILRPLRERNA